MNHPNMGHNRQLTSAPRPRPSMATWLFAFWCAVLVVGCASAPPPAPPVTAPAPQTRAERVTAALNTLGFEKKDDGWYLTLPAPLVFGFDSDAVSDTGRSDVARVARQMRELDVDRVFVYGHSDNVGAAQYNQSLSQRRADAIARVLMDGEFPANRITAKGLAASVPIATNATDEGRAKNRRVVIVVQID